MTATAILDLERAGFTREQVEALARLIETQLATKADLANLATKAELANLATKAEIANLATKAEIANVATKTEVAELRGELRREIAEVKSDLIKWMAGFGIAQLGGLLGVAYAILRLFPGGHP